ncbi:MAG: zf-TFIIB domain-containing protein [Candidatus Gracilibacteria bacterium]|nr:zf-TFIIB domain-containing protein [Candidatus Gracilibacteria bacterium]
MKCPVCKDITLLMSEKNGVEIDYCPECRGIWLDRGELEKLINAEKKYNNFDDDLSDNYKNKDFDNNKNYGYKKKKSFLDAFDFFD